MSVVHLSSLIAVLSKGIFDTQVTSRCQSLLNCSLYGLLYSFDHSIGLRTIWRDILVLLPALLKLHLQAEETNAGPLYVTPAYGLSNCLITSSWKTRMAVVEVCDFTAWITGQSSNAQLPKHYTCPRSNHGMGCSKVHKVHLDKTQNWLDTETTDADYGSCQLAWKAWPKVGAWISLQRWPQEKFLDKTDLVDFACQWPASPGVAWSTACRSETIGSTRSLFFVRFISVPSISGKRFSHWPIHSRTPIPLKEVRYTLTTSNIFS